MAPLEAASSDYILADWKVVLLAKMTRVAWTVDRMASMSDLSMAWRWVLMKAALTDAMWGGRSVAMSVGMTAASWAYSTVSGSTRLDSVTVRLLQPPH